MGGGKVFMLDAAGLRFRGGFIGPCPHPLTVCNRGHIKGS